MLEGGIMIDITNWNKKANGIDEDYSYTCACGAVMTDEDYNSDNGAYACQICCSESPDIENIPFEE